MRQEKIDERGQKHERTTFTDKKKFNKGHYISKWESHDNHMQIFVLYCIASNHVRRDLEFILVSLFGIEYLNGLINSSIFFNTNYFIITWITFFYLCKWKVIID